MSSPASTCCGPRHASSSRATSSTGGTRRPVGACARSISDDRLWLPYAVDRYLAVTGDDRRPRRDVPYLEGPPLRPEQHDAYFQPERSPAAEPLFEHCAAAIDCSLARRRPRPAADRDRRLERRHEPRRRRGPGRERLARLVPVHASLAAFVADRRGARRRGPRRALAGAHEERCGAALERARLGRRLVPPRLLRRRHAARLGRATPSAGSTRSPSRGASCRAPPTRRGRAGDGGGRGVPRAPRRRPGPAVHAAVRPRRRSIRATSRAICPASARTAASTRTRAIWSVLAFAALGDGDKAGELFSILNPINHASTPGRRPPLQGRAVRHGRRRLRRAAARRPRRLDLVHGRRRAGCTRPGVEWILGFRLRGTTLRSIPASRAPGPASRSTSATTPRGTRSSSRTRTGSVAGCVVGGARRTAAGRRGAAIPLADDGATHRVRVVLG